MKETEVSDWQSAVLLISLTGCLCWRHVFAVLFKQAPEHWHTLNPEISDLAWGWAWIYLWTGFRADSHLPTNRTLLGVPILQKSSLFHQAIQTILKKLNISASLHSGPELLKTGVTGGLTENASSTSLQLYVRICTRMKSQSTTAERSGLTDGDRGQYYHHCSAGKSAWISQ